MVEVKLDYHTNVSNTVYYATNTCIMQVLICNDICCNADFRYTNKATDQTVVHKWKEGRKFKFICNK